MSPSKQHKVMVHECFHTPMTLRIQMHQLRVDESFCRAFLLKGPRSTQEGKVVRLFGIKINECFTYLIDG